MPDIQPGVASSAVPTAVPTTAQPDSGGASIGWEGEKPAVTQPESHGSGEPESGASDFEDNEFGFEADSGESFDDFEADDKPRSLKQFAEQMAAGLSSQDPQVKKRAEKELKRVYNERQRYQEHFKTPEEAEHTVSRLSTLGGLEAVEQEIGEMATFLNAWNAGDQGVLDTWLRENPKGVSRSAPILMKAWAQLNPDGYAHGMATAVMADLTSKGTISALNTLSTMIGKVPEAIPLFNQIVDTINKWDEAAKSQPQSNANPELDQRSQALATKEKSLYIKELRTEAVPVMNRGMKAAMMATIGGTKLSQQAQKDLQNDITGAFGQIMAGDKDFQDRKKALLEAGDSDGYMKLLKSAIRQKGTEAARRAWRKYKGISGISTQQKQERSQEGSRQREVGAGSGGAGAIPRKIARADHASMDWDRMNADAKRLGAKDGEDLFLWKRQYYVRGDKRLYENP